VIHVKKGRVKKRLIYTHFEIEPFIMKSSTKGGNLSAQFGNRDQKVISSGYLFESASWRKRRIIGSFSVTPFLPAIVKDISFPVPTLYLPDK
jgi:hypothetical protein